MSSPLPHETTAADYSPKAPRTVTPGFDAVLGSLASQRAPGTQYNPRIDEYETGTPPQRPDHAQNSLNTANVAGPLLDYISSLGNSRELSLAKTNVEQALLWLGAHFAKNV